MSTNSKNKSSGRNHSSVQGSAKVASTSEGTAASVELTRHDGPLPDVQQLRGYDELINNGAERIMQMAEKHLEHSMKMEEKILEVNEAQFKRGQKFAFGVAIFGMSASTVVALCGQIIPASVLGAAGLTGLAAAFLKKYKE